MFKAAMIDFDLGLMSRMDFIKVYERFYADAEPIIENLEDEDNEKED